MQLQPTEIGYNYERHERTNYVEMIHVQILKHIKRTWANEHVSPMSKDQENFYVHVATAAAEKMLV